MNLSERISDYLPVLATAKAANINRFGQVHGHDFEAQNPETVGGAFIAEPKDPDPSVPARFKTRRVLQGRRGEKIVALSADVVFVNGSRHFKPERLETTSEELLEEAEGWYCSDAFVVHWLISFVVETSDGSVKRIAVLDVRGQYHQPLDAAEVRDSFNDQINTRIPLVEKGANGKANFSLSNSYRQDEIEIDYELAYQLIVDRVLPVAWLNNLIEDRAELVDIDDETWEFVAISLLNNQEGESYDHV